jgi:formamidopyrimidine-DNA glycosylase
LRWPIAADLPRLVQGQPVRSVRRRGKYLLLETPRGSLILHLGMSGSLRLTAPDAAIGKHDHFDLMLENRACLRFHDPRRFGSLLWVEGDPARHPLLAGLGPEPLEPRFDGRYLYERSRGRRSPVKSLIMDSHLVVGVGNIYANESLFQAGILPARQAGKISNRRYEGLAKSIKSVLEAAIAKGGTTLRDFVNEAGRPGYFRQTLRVYERAGNPCLQCGSTIRVARLAQRSTYWCVKCQH